MVPSNTVGESRAGATRRIVLIGLMFAGFISLGLPDGLLGVAWPSMAATRGVSVEALGTLLVAGSAGFITASVFSGRLIARLGVGGLLTAAGLTTSLSLLGLALVPSWWLMLPLAMLLGAGGGCIDGGLNTYAAATTSARVLTWLHGFYGVGATAGPILMTALLAAGRPWQWGYLAVGIAQLALALCFGLTRGLWAAGAHADSHAVRSPVGLRETMALPAVWLSALLFLLYTGLEVSAGQWAFTLFTIGRGVAPELAGQWVALYWGGLTAGRFVAGALASRLSPQTLLWIGGLGAAGGAALLGLVAAPWASAVGMVTMGAALAPIFPALIGTTAIRVGAAHAPNTIGLQVAAANIGAAGIPWAVGLVAAAAGIPAIGPTIVVVAAAYLVIFVVASGRGRERP
jgi:fucose permease